MNVWDTFADRFSAQQTHYLQLVAHVSAEMHVRSYLVGGVVRDLLLQRPLKDLDIVIVGNALPFATRLQTQHGGKLITHPQFKTAAWTVPQAAIEPIDFITARRETYAQPAALPTVQFGSMRDDLQRRDFTINTLAMRLDHDRFGQLVDLFGGSADLNAGLIRILHPQSFVDDPTRIFRAVRYEQRLGFTLADDTHDQLRDSLSGIQNLTADRVRHEVEHILREPNWSAMLDRMQTLGVLAAIHPELRWQATWEADFERLTDSTFAEQVEARLMLWLSRLELPAQLAILRRLGARRKLLDSAESAHAIQQTLAQLASNATPSTIEQQLRPYAKRPLARLIARTRQANTRVGEWLTLYEEKWRHINPTINGNDLRAYGLQPGPHFRDILDALRAAWLDGKIAAPDDERRFLASLLDHKV